MGTYTTIHGIVLHECDVCGWRGNVCKSPDGTWRCHWCSLEAYKRRVAAEYAQQAQEKGKSHE